MKRPLKAFGCFGLIVSVCAMAGATWLYFYTGDLPSISGLQQFDPATQSEARFQLCDHSEVTVGVVPYDSLGRYVLSAVIAAEGEVDTRSPYLYAMRSVTPEKSPRIGRYALQVSRSLTCSRRSLRRQFEELRIANALNRRFDNRQLITIYLNRIYVGDGVYGIEGGAAKYFGKHASELSLDEAALLVGIIRAPSAYSPIHHPERAVARRNYVLDQMTDSGSISPLEAQQAKATELRLVGDIQKPSR